MEVVPSIESYAGPKDKHTWLKWTIAALVAILNGYAAVMMYASGEWVFALLDLVVVSVGLYVFMNKKTYAHRYIFPGVLAWLFLSSSLLPTRSASPSPTIRDPTCSPSSRRGITI